jgi:hypothetical protein
MTILASGPLFAHRGRDHDHSPRGRRSPLGYGWAVRARLLDRDEEVRALTGQLAAVRQGAGRVIVVEGPAGIGKSSLLDVVARRAHEEGVAVLRARGGPLEQDAAWGWLVSCLSRCGRVSSGANSR